jgi:hypothetical protein
MKIKEFTYTKPNGEVSQRTVVELVTPTEHIEGIDVSELDMDSYAEFTKQLNELEKEIYNKRIELYSQFDLTHNYRRFVPSRMTNVTTEFA